MAGSAVVGALRVSLGLDSANFTNGLTSAQSSMQRAGQRMQAVGDQMMQVGAGLTAGLTLPLVAFGVSLANGARDAAMASGQVQAALTSMGDGAGRSLEQLTSQAERLSATSLFDDDDILKSVTANLLTFGNVAGESFDRAQQAALDLSQRLGQDLQSSAVMVGKALNDPTQGLSALRRVGIQFTADQEALIRSMDAAGDSAGAQAIMLDELERQFGGASAAARAADPMAAAMIDLGRAMGTLEQAVAPLMVGFAGMVSRIASFLEALSPAQAQIALFGGIALAAIGPIIVAMGALVSAAGVLLPVIGAIGAPFLIIAAAVAAVAVALYVFRDELIPIVQSFAASIQENLGPKIAPLWEAIKAAAAAVGELFNAIFGDGSPGGATEAIKTFGDIIARIFAGAVDLITGAINVITNIMRAFGALLRGDFSAMWGFLGAAVMSAVRGISNAFQTLFPDVVSFVRQTYEGVKNWLLDRFTALVQGIGEKVGQVTNFFRNLYVAVVGNSYIPDMVREIGEWMGPRLQDAMVNPAAAAIDETAMAFEGMGTSINSTLEGVFQSIASKDWKGALSGVLDMLGGQGGKIGAFGKIAGAIFRALPGFKTGGSFKVGGSGGADSQMMAFRATPGEMVDIRRPGQDSGGTTRVIVTTNDDRFNAYVDNRASPIAAQAGVAAYQGARQAVPSELFERQRYRRA